MSTKVRVIIWTYLVSNKVCCFFRLLCFFFFFLYRFSLAHFWKINISVSDLNKSCLVCSCADSASIPSKEDIIVIMVLLNIPVSASFSYIYQFGRNPEVVQGCVDQILEKCGGQTNAYQVF